jgi:hypothetical protein
MFGQRRKRSDLTENSATRPVAFVPADARLDLAGTAGEIGAGAVPLAGSLPPRQMRLIAPARRTV